MVIRNNMTLANAYKNKTKEVAAVKKWSMESKCPITGGNGIVRDVMGETKYGWL